MKRILAALITVVFMLSAAASASEPSLKQFTAIDMRGDEYTQEIFAPYDLTMVNIWATWCGFCIAEMPYFPKLMESLPENVNMITICDDAEMEWNLATFILLQTQSNYITLQANASLYDALLKDIYSFPTTVFVDSEGNIVGDIQYGIPPYGDPVTGYTQLINDRLALLEGNK